MKRIFPLWASEIRFGRDRNGRLLAVVVAALTLILFILELEGPVGVEAWLPNVAVVLLSLWFPARWQTYLTTFICSVLTILGLFFSPTMGEPWVAWLNRFLGIMMFWITAWMGLATRRTAELEDMNLRLRLEIAERQRGEEKLAEQASLINLAQDAILVRDMEDRILFWNRGAERLYGWTAEEALGKNAIELLSQSCIPGVGEARQELLRTGTWTGSLRQLTKDGKHLFVQSRWTLVRDVNSIPKSVLIVTTDMTEKRILESQLLRTQRLESVGILAGGVAHDFNNLLTPILMGVKLLREGRTEQERQNLLTTLQASAQRGAEMVRKLLSFAGGADTAMVPVQLRYVVKEVQSILDHSFPKAITIKTALVDDLFALRADITQLSQVLMNLCVNARDAMPDGGVLTIAAQNVKVDGEFIRRHGELCQGVYVHISVTDTGRGIAPEIIDRIFDPFFTTKEHGKGSGLGLSSVVGIVRSHDGLVDVQSEVNVGTRFDVYIPAAPQAAPSQAETFIALPASGNGALILAVDDEAAILKTVETVLEESGYRVLTAADGDSALRLYSAHQHEIQVVLLDLMMPGMDGLAIIKALRLISPNVRILASSGLRPVGPLAAEIGAGGLGFLQKPYSSEQLLAHLGRLLQLPSIAS